MRTLITDFLPVPRSENGAVHFWKSGLSDASVVLDHGGNSKETPLTDHSDAITCLHVADSRNGQEGYLTSASEDGTIQLYRIGTDLQ